MRVALVTLGCDKNTVDMEYLGGALAARDHEIVSQGALKDIDVLVIHTCAFIADAREQSIETIQAALRARDQLGDPRRIVVTGCLSQRMADRLPGELDAVLGVGRIERMAQVVEQVGRQEAPGAIVETPQPDMRHGEALPRLPIADSFFAYLRVADGCDHRCAFCAIPAIKGAYRSVPREVLVAEAQELVRRGAREINLIGQDIGPYGRDLYGTDYDLAELLGDLAAIEGDFWLRLLYLYPAAVSDRLLERIAGEEKIVNYLDVPFQHLDDSVLQRMGRPGGKVSPPRAVERMRAALPDVALRTTFLVGHPGETSKAFRRLLDGIRTLRFDRLGAFAFSPEEGTPAAAMADRPSASVARKRLDRLMEAQAEVSAICHEALVGSRMRVLVEDIDEQEQVAVGRSWRDAPEVDGQVFIEGRNEVLPVPGSFVEVEIVEAGVYDLVARPIEGAPVS